MKYAIALVILAVGLGIGYAVGWNVAQPSEAERRQAAAYEWRAKAGRRTNADAVLSRFASGVWAGASRNPDIAAIVDRMKSPIRFPDPAHVAPNDVGRCVSWEFRVCPDAKLWNGPDPANVPGAETLDLVWGQFTFADGWVYTSVDSNWKSAWGDWQKEALWSGGQPPEWFDRAVIITGTVEPKAGVPRVASVVR